MAPFICKPKNNKNVAFVTLKDRENISINNQGFIVAHCPCGNKFEFDNSNFPQNGLNCNCICGQKIIEYSKNI